MNRPVSLSLLLTFISSFTLFAQSWTKIDSVFSPFGVTAQNFSAPEYCDLDGDGDLDLIVGSLSGDRIDYFENKGTAQSPLFRKDTNMFASIYAKGFQYTNSTYVATVDLDHDGDVDLIIGGFNGLLMYWNIGDSTEAVWQKDSAFFAGINALIGTDAKPAFADLDGDGDADVLVGIGESLFGGPTAGTSLAFRNTGTPSKAVFTQDNSLSAGIPDVGLNAYPTFRDLDDDGDFDLVMGRDLQTMIYYKNTGTKHAPVWTNTAGILSVLESTSYWKNPVFADLDGDGDADLTYGSSDGTIYYYQNIGTKSAPSFQRNTNYFQLIRTDGNAATVSIADYDKDGDLDIVSGDWLGRFQFFRNDGNATAPNFKKITAPFSSLDAGSYSSPKFFDIDNDGDIDIVSGELLGTIKCYINTGGTFTQNTSLFTGITVGYRSAPAFVDIDNDGKMDMLVGAEEAAKLTFYTNTGNNVFAAENGFIEGVVGSRNSHPVFVDLDRDGDFDLAIGVSSGRIYYYENTGDKTFPVWKRNDAIFDGVKVKQDAAPGFADFDGDGKPDLIVSEYNGNFSFYKNRLPTSVRPDATAAPERFSLEQNFPNPFNPSTGITFSIVSAGELSLEIFDLLGRSIEEIVRGYYQPGTYTVTWNAGHLPSGVYLYRLQSRGSVETKRMMLLK